MIYIKEDKAKKLAGNTAIFISFSFNKDIIHIIKSSGTYAYDKKTHVWELPVNSLAFILDNLTYFDDITLIIDESMTSCEPQRNSVLTHVTAPFSYQLDGINYGLNHDKWLLLDQMGLGKTLQIIYIAEELKVQENLEHCLIICGLNTLKSNWRNEIKKHSTLDCRILGEKTSKKGRVTYGSLDDRAKELIGNIKEFFIITNIETFRSEKALNALLNSSTNIGMVVVDEIHKAVSSKSHQGQNLLKIKGPKYKYKIGSTGTLLLNNPLDAYVPLNWIEKENISLTNFKNTYCEFNSEQKAMITGYKNLEILKDTIESCSLRRTKDLLNLPPKTIINEYGDISDEHRKFYENIESGIIEEAAKVELNLTNVLAMITRLRQATACPTALTEVNILSSKLERATDLIEQITSNNDKAVIMSTFKESLYALERMLSGYKILIATGDQKPEEIDDAINKFQNNDEYKIMLCTHSKMGIGVTLNKASYMICIDTPWTWGAFEQMTDRIHRIGTKQPVFIYKLICKDTIDEGVDFILNFKKAISDYIVDDKLDNKALEYLKNYISELTRETCLR